MKFLGAILTAPLAAFAAPILEARGEAIPGKWIAVLKDSATNSLHTTFTGILGGSAPKHTYKIGGFHGYSISASDDAISSIAKSSLTSKSASTPSRARAPRHGV